MTPKIFVIIDDREALTPELERFVGDLHFGDIIRRRKRYLDELTAAASEADDVIILHSQNDADALVRRIETARGDVLWLRLPTAIAPIDLERLSFSIQKMRYALDPVMLGPVFEDDAPTVLFSKHAVSLISARSVKARRALILKLKDEASLAQNGLQFVDLRQPENLRLFLSGATETRSFNKLSVGNGILKKSSTDRNKMRAEFNFYQFAPPAMRRFLLPTFDFQEDDKGASYSMEHMQVPDASLQYVLGTFSQVSFDQLLSQFFTFINSRERKRCDSDTVVKTGQFQIIQKMVDRSKSFLTSDTGAKVNAYLTAAGIQGGVSGLQKRIMPFVEEALKTNAADYLAFSHGDPCLSNILFDSRIGLVRFIDPRGATEKTDAFLHPIYDVAKFSHSICGGYDFINSGLFSLEVDEKLTLNLRRLRGKKAKWMDTVFRNRLQQEGWSISQVRAVEATLFLSMLPLHLDHERKVLGFALIAHDIIQELEATHD